MYADIPSIRALMGAGPFPREIEYMLEHLEHDLFAPWVDLDAAGEINTTAAARLFGSWLGNDPGQLRYACRPSIEGGHIHTAFSAIGGIHFYGAAESSIDEGADLFPPGIFGAECVVRAGARLCGPFILGEKVRVGSSHLSRAVVGCRTRIASNVTGGDFIAAPDCMIGAGVVLQSDTDDGSEEVTMRDFRKLSQPLIRTGRTRMGPIIGRGCRVYSSLRAGTILMPGCIVPMGEDLPAGVYSPQILRELRMNQNKGGRVRLFLAQALSVARSFFSREKGHIAA